MAHTLTERDLALLAHLHPQLCAVVMRAAEITPIPFRVTEGMRTVERQRELVKRGVSKTMNSRHLTGHAVDIVPYVDYDGDGDIDAKDLYAWPLYYQLAPAIKQAAKELGVKIEWGGDWRTFKDGPHWQLDWKQYPADAPWPEAKEAPPYTGKTDRGRAAAVGAGGAGVATAVSVAAEPVQKVIEAVDGQSDALTSGDVARIAVAGVIIALTIFAFVRASK